MAECSPSCIRILLEQLKKLNGHSRVRALDVGGGDGRLCLNLLLYEYLCVDLLEPSSKGIKKAKAALASYTRMDQIIETTMEDFVFEHEYTAVFMVWVSGYLCNEALVTFLKKAKAQLDTSAGPSRRKSKPGSFIFLFDNVLDEGHTREPEKGQRFRTEREFEAIFAEANLIEYDHSGPKPMPGNRLNVKLWVLY